MLKIITYVDPERHPWNSVKFQSKGVSKLSTSSYFDVYPFYMDKHLEAHTAKANCGLQRAFDYSLIFF